MNKTSKMEMEIFTLKRIIKDTFWMARRYAHGRHTFSPDTVRTCYKTIKKYFPDIKINHDIAIKSPENEKSLSFFERSDYLDDCND